MTKEFSQGSFMSLNGLLTKIEGSDLKGEGGEHPRADQGSKLTKHDLRRKLELGAY